MQQNNLKILLRTQYDLIKSSRAVVLDYVSKMPVSFYVKEIENFGKGSIRNTQTHIANTYIYWLENYGRQKSLEYYESSAIKNASEASAAFFRIDQIVDDFVEEFSDDLFKELNLKLPKRETYYSSTPLSLFTHVITHEFHHKGQIMSMGRTLGFLPPDADAIRFE